MPTVTGSALFLEFLTLGARVRKNTMANRQEKKRRQEIVREIKRTERAEAEAAMPIFSNVVDRQVNSFHRCVIRREGAVILDDFT
jgi:hypothetical protein